VEQSLNLNRLILNRVTIFNLRYYSNRILLNRSLNFNNQGSKVKDQKNLD